MQLAEWLETMKIKINPEKCVAVMLTRKRPNINMNMKFNNTPIPCKYLGVYMDNKLTW